MKIRNGFVSNSSSSSFCIYGTHMDYSDLVEKLKSTTMITEKFSSEELEEMEDNGEWYELVDTFESSTDLSLNYSDDDVWIGREWSSIGDDETGSQFKESVKKDLEKLFGEGVSCDTYDETIYN